MAILRSLIRWTVVILSGALGVGLIVYLIADFGIKDIQANVWEFGLLAFFGLLAISLTNFSIATWRWQLIINAHTEKERRMGFFRVFVDRLAGLSASYLTPAAQVGGEPVRITLLSTGEKKVTVKEATSSVILDVAVELIAYVFFIVLGALFALYYGLGDQDSLVAIAGVLSVLVAFLGLFFLFTALGKGFFGHLFKLIPHRKHGRIAHLKLAVLETEELMTDFLRENPKRFALVVFLAIAIVGVRIVETFYVAHFLGQSLTFSQAFLIGTLPTAALLLPIPGSLGVYEGSFIALFSALGLAINPLAFAFIIRARDFTLVVLGAIRIVTKGWGFIQKRIFGIGEEV